MNQHFCLFYRKISKFWTNLMTCRHYSITLFTVCFWPYAYVRMYACLYTIELDKTRVNRCKIRRRRKRRNEINLKRNSTHERVVRKNVCRCISSNHIKYNYKYKLINVIALFIKTIFNIHPYRNFKYIGQITYMSLHWCSCFCYYITHLYINWITTVHENLKEKEKERQR